MKASTKKFYHKGVDNQKRADIIFSVSRPKKDQMKNWSTHQKIVAYAFVEDIKNTMEIFSKELLEAIN